MSTEPDFYRVEQLANGQWAVVSRIATLPRKVDAELVAQAMNEKHERDEGQGEALTLLSVVHR